MGRGKFFFAKVAEIDIFFQHLISLSPYAFPLHSSNRQNIPLLLDYSDIHVFDFEPTLKTLAIRAVLDYDIDQSLLPQCIRYMFILYIYRLQTDFSLKFRSEIRSMTMSNTISRPLNSTG